MNTSAKRRITSRARPKNKANIATPLNSALPTLSVIGRIVTGMCFYCFETLTAMQPGGTEVQHLDGTPYKQCRQFLDYKKAKPRC